MASIYYLIDDALHIPDDIVQKYSQRDQSFKDTHFAAINIQRSWRGYSVRTKLNEKHRAAIVLQKYVRGWLVRYFIPDQLLEQHDQLCLDLYNKMATRLQAAWKGFKVRQELNIIKKVKKPRSFSESELGLGDIIHEEEEVKEPEAICKDDEIVDGGTGIQLERACKERILRMLFDRHHLISTKVKKGILGDLSELKEIEKVLASLPWKNYMTNLRKIYNNNYYEQLHLKKPYIFSNKKLRKEEDLLRLRDKHNEKKETSMIGYVPDQRKPFTLNIKSEKPSYERYLSLQGKFVVPERHIVRTEDKTKNICEQEFILNLRKVVQKSKVPPYYADFWYEECSGHNLVD